MSDKKDLQELKQLINICFWITVGLVAGTAFLPQSSNFEIVEDGMLLVAGTSGVLLVVFYLIKEIKYRGTAVDDR